MSDYTGIPNYIFDPHGLSQTNMEEIVNPYDDNSNLMQSIALLPVKCTSTLAPVDRNQQIGVIKQRQSLGS